MAWRRTMGVAVVITLAVMLAAACGSGPTAPSGTGGGQQTGGNGGGSTGGGTTPPPATTAVLKVMIDAGCSGKDSNVQVYVDGSNWGLAQPGDAGVSRSVSIGNHSISAAGQRGTQWGPFSIAVPSNGYVSTLTCANSPTPTPSPTTSTLRVFVDANCSGKASNIGISIDGIFSGTTQPGSGGISKVVSVGNHTIFGQASNGTTWSTFTVAVPTNGLSEDLTCK